VKVNEGLWTSVHLEEYRPEVSKEEERGEEGTIESIAVDPPTPADTRLLQAGGSTRGSRRTESKVEALVALLCGFSSGSKKTPMQTIAASSLCSFIQPFEPAYFWFKAFTIVERALLAGVIVLLQGKRHTDYQVGFSTAIVFAGLVVSGSTTPFIQNGEDWVDITQRLSNSLTSIVAILIHTNVLGAQTSNILLLTIFFATIANFIASFKPSRILNQIRSTVKMYYKVTAGNKLLTEEKIKSFSNERLEGLTQSDLGLWTHPQRKALLKYHSNDKFVLKLVGKSQGLISCLQEFEEPFQKSFFLRIDDTLFASLLCERYRSLKLKDDFFAADEFKERLTRSFELAGTDEIMPEELEQSVLAWPDEWRTTFLDKHAADTFIQRPAINELIHGRLRTKMEALLDDLVDEPNDDEDTQRPMSQDTGDMFGQDEDGEDEEDDEDEARPPPGTHPRPPPPGDAKKAPAPTPAVDEGSML
jgi:hypothetical protein